MTEPIGEKLTPAEMEEFKKWEKIMKDQGLGVIEGTVQEDLEKAGWEVSSLELSAETEHEIKKGLDDAVETENIFSSEIPLNKSGLPPCQRVKLENERNINRQDPRLKKD